MDNEVADLDVFTENWNQFKLAYVFPPPFMMELILNRVYKRLEESKFIVICPWKPKANWFLKLMKPPRIPISWCTVTDLAESGMVPNTPRIRCKAWMLVGQPQARGLSDRALQALQ